MGLELKYQSTVSRYEEIHFLELAGELKDEVIKLRHEYSKMHRDLGRLSMAIKRDAQNVEGWTCIE